MTMKMWAQCGHFQRSHVFFSSPSGSGTRNEVKSYEKTINSRIHHEDERTSWNNISSLNLFRRIKMQYTPWHGMNRNECTYLLVYPWLSFVSFWHRVVIHIFIFLSFLSKLVHKKWLIIQCLHRPKCYGNDNHSRRGIFTWLLFA